VAVRLRRDTLSRKLSAQESSALAAGAVLAALVVALVAGGMFRSSQARQRDAGYLAYCAARGYQYTASRPGAEQAYANMVGLFNVGFGRSWRCEISGTFKGEPFVAFEYGFGDHDRRARDAPLIVHAIMKWERQEKQLPEFYILPASHYYEAASSYPATRVEFPDDLLLTETYALLAKDPQAVRAFMTPEIRSALGLVLAPDPNQYVTGNGRTLFWYELGYLPAPDQLDQFIAVRDMLRVVIL
jgi:hypothetical protein